MKHQVETKEKLAQWEAFIVENYATMRNVDIEKELKCSSSFIQSVRARRKLVKDKIIPTQEQIDIVKKNRSCPRMILKTMSGLSIHEISKLLDPPKPIRRVNLEMFDFEDYTKNLVTI